MNLTAYESSVLSLLAKGMSNKEIARELDKPLTAIEMATRKVFKKLVVTSRLQAAVKYLEEQKIC